MSDTTGKLEPGVVPMSSRPEVHESLRTVIIFCVLITIWSALRLYARRVRGTPLHVEDGLFYLAVVAYYGMAVAFFIAIFFGGVGYHIEQLQRHHVARLTQSILIIQGLYALSMCACKWSILWMLKRVFVVPVFSTLTWIIMAIQGAWMLMTVLIGLLICRPIQKNWDPTAKGVCGDQIAGFTAVSVINVTIDVAMCILPLPMIYRLQVKTPYKMALFGIFSIGVVTVIFAVVRLLSLRRINFDDFSYSVPTVITWTYAETGVIILVACSPLLRPVFDKAFRRFLSITRSKNQSTGASAGSQNHHLSASRDKPSTRNSRMRNGFITVGDSEESLELGNLTGEGLSHSQATSSRDPPPFSDTAPLCRPPDKDLRVGILVEKEISQTVTVTQHKPS